MSEKPLPIIRHIKSRYKVSASTQNLNCSPVAFESNPARKIAAYNDAVPIDKLHFD